LEKGKTFYLNINQLLNISFPENSLCSSEDSVTPNSDKLHVGWGRERKTPSLSRKWMNILLMEEILHHLGWLKT